MKKTVLAPVAILALTLGLTGSASGASNPVHGTCFAQFVSSSENDVGGTLSVAAHEERPFGTTVPAYIPGFKCPEEE
jgi:uncharacterized membrane protein